MALGVPLDSHDTKLSELEVIKNKDLGQVNHFLTFISSRGHQQPLTGSRFHSPFQKRSTKTQNCHERGCNSYSSFLFSSFSIYSPTGHVVWICLGDSFEANEVRGPSEVYKFYKSLLFV